VFGGLLTFNYFSVGFLAGDIETRRQRSEERRGGTECDACMAAKSV